MTIATRLLGTTGTEQRIAKAVRQILGADTAAWIENAGPERLARRLRTEETRAERETFTVHFEAWRTVERTATLRADGNLNAWLDTLVNARSTDSVHADSAFAAAFDEAQGSTAADERTDLRLIRITQIKNGEGHSLPWSEGHSTWTDEAQAHASADRMREGTVPQTLCAERAQTTLRLGRATAVERTITVTGKTTHRTGDIAGMARAATSLVAPERWSHTTRYTPTIDYLAWVHFDSRRYTPPPATRLMRQYAVRVARVLKEHRTVIVEGPRDDHEPMLADAMVTADHCNDWELAPGYTCDYVDGYRAFDGDGDEDFEEVPDALRMLERI